MDGMKFFVQKGKDRGHANHGWLDTYFSFSFADYYNPLRMNFGKLRVLNEDRIHPLTGFGKHSHDNMEIMTIVLEGELEHEDNTGSKGFLRPGEVQVMSAGRGITHSESNPSRQYECRLLQIWILPSEPNLKPRYSQKNFKWMNIQNQLVPIVSGQVDPSLLMVRQNVWISLGNFDKKKILHYTPKLPENGIFVFVIEGSLEVLNQELETGSSIEIEDLLEFTIHFHQNSRLLIMEVPLH